MKKNTLQKRRLSPSLISEVISDGVVTYYYTRYDGASVPISEYARKFIEQIDGHGVGSACYYDDIFPENAEKVKKKASELSYEVNCLLGNDCDVLFQNLTIRDVIVGVSMTIKDKRSALQNNGVFPEHPNPVSPEHARRAAAPCSEAQRPG